MIIGLISLGFSMAAIVLSVWALIYTKRQAEYARRQTELMEQQESRKKREDATTDEWAKKFDEAVAQAMTIAPKWFNNSRGAVYPCVFQDQELRQRIEAYLIIADFGRNHHVARQMSSDLLRMPAVQRTIQEVIDNVKKFKETDPAAKALGL
jgi:hypothetical protein